MPLGYQGKGCNNQTLDFRSALIISSPRARFVYECVQLHKKDEGEQRRPSLLLIFHLLVHRQDCRYLLFLSGRVEAEIRTGYLKDGVFVCAINLE